MPHAQRLRLRRNREKLEVCATRSVDAGNSYRLEGPDGAYEVNEVVVHDNRIEARIDGELARASVYLIDDNVFVLMDGNTERIQLQGVVVGDFRSVANPRGNVAAPMPGAITAVAVAAGDRVKAGQTLMVLEAMKMEHNIVAPGDGKIVTVNVAPGDRVDEGTELLSLED